MEWMKDFWMWVLIGALIIGGALYIFFPQDQQSDKVILQWQNASKQGVIIVKVFELDTEKALDIFKQTYPDYVIIDYTKTEDGILIKARKK
ncbi:MAG TPA: hypothetical protein ENF81_05780 [Thermotogaceae bacterium]|nr:hypothetical protein [Thermotogaceae bacterium]